MATMNEDRLLQLMDDLVETRRKAQQIRQAANLFRVDVTDPLQAAVAALQEAEGALTHDLGAAVKRARLPLPRVAQAGV
jgi:hypothetical protein